MTEYLLAATAALWAGILASISPCPMATNMTAVSYIGRQVGRSKAVLFAGLLYTLGRSAAYLMICALLTAGLFSVPALSQFLQKQINQLLGPILIIVGLCLLKLLRFPAFSGKKALSWATSRADHWGLWGAGVLGFAFALSFCPVSAALFFGSLLPLTIKHHSILLFPILFGVGTAIPVLGLAMALSFGGQMAGKALNKMSSIDTWARRITGGLFILAGTYFMLIYIFKLSF